MGRASPTRRQGASEPTDHRPRHAMGCRPSGLIHIQQVRGISPYRKYQRSATTITSGGTGIRRSWTAALAADSGDDASTQPGRACHRSTQQCRWACAQGSMQWPWSGGELLKVAVDRGCPVGVGVLDRLGGLVGSVGGEQGGFLGRDGSCVAL
jgi:hypothetical protein